MIHRVFIGRFGLRAGWSLLIYFVILVIVIFSVHVVVRHIETDNPARNTSVPTAKSLMSAPMLTRTLIEDSSFVIFLFASWLMAIIERRKLSAFGLGGARPLKRFLAGTAWGLLTMSLLIAILHSFQLLRFDAQLLHGPSIIRWGAIQFSAFLFLGLVEEYVFRGYLQFTLTRGFIGIGSLISPRDARSIAFWVASLLTSALFLAAHTHNSGENKVGLLQVFAVGLVFVTALWRTGSLWWAIGFHMAWDWAQSFLYGVPDSGGLMQGRLFATHALGNPLFSGGANGPEGSVLSIPILLLAVAGLTFLHSSPQPSLEIES